MVRVDLLIQLEEDLDLHLIVDLDAEEDNMEVIYNGMESIWRGWEPHSPSIPEDNCLCGRNPYGWER